MTLRGWVTTPIYPHGERWRRKSMHFECEPTTLEAQGRLGEQCEEELRDKHAGSRMDDDGCPNAGRTSSGEATEKESQSS